MLEEIIEGRAFAAAKRAYESSDDNAKAQQALLDASPLARLVQEFHFASKADEIKALEADGAPPHD